MIDSPVQEAPPPRLAWRMRAGFAVAAAVVIVVTAGAVVGMGTMQLDRVSAILHRYAGREPFRAGTVTPAAAGGPETLLLVGSDRRYGDARGQARSDTLMLIHLDPGPGGATTLLSIPRDLAVGIPGHGRSKINAAYGEGGLDLTTRTVKRLLSFPGRPFRINHAIAINFRGFREAVDAVHCVYVDVDRRYYHSNLGLPVGQRYAEIDIQPGYQRLCGPQALSYVRFRHLDNDIVRAARQQEFLRDAAAQVSAGNVLGHLGTLVTAFAKSISSDADLQSRHGIVRMLHLLAAAAGEPVRQIHFPATFVQSAAPATLPAAGRPVPGLGDYVTATRSQIRRTLERFLHPGGQSGGGAAAGGGGGGGSTAHPASRPVRGASAASFGLVGALAAAQAIVRPALAASHFRMPFYAPGWLTPAGRYPPSTGIAPSPRLYVLTDRAGRRHAAYRLVVEQNPALGQYYGIQGTTWTDPPILDAPHSIVRMADRRYAVYRDGAHIRLVAWRTRRAAYWVSNTLTRDLTNRAMLGIARSLMVIRAG